MNRIRIVRWVGLLTTLAMFLSGAVVVSLLPALPARADVIVVDLGAVCTKVTVAGVQSGCQTGLTVGSGQENVAQVVPDDYGPTVDIRGTALPTSPSTAAAAWTPFFTDALEKIAEQRGITPDQRNQAFGVPEARAVLVDNMFEIIHKHATGQTLSSQERAAYDALVAQVHHERQAAATKEMEDLDGVTANPCGLQNLDTGEWITNPWPVPVGDPLSYYKTIAPACRSIWNNIAADYPLPTIEQFREWGRDQVMGDHFSLWADGKDPQDTNPLTSSQLVITNPIELNSPWLNHQQALAEAKTEFEHAIGSLPQGFAFLTAARGALEETPAGDRTEAANELLAQIEEAAAEFGAERFQESVADITSTLTEPLWDLTESEIAAGEVGSQAALETVIAENLSGLFEAGLQAGAAIGGATAALAINIAFLVSQQQIRDALQADVNKGAGTPDLDQISATEEGRQELITDLIISLLPDNNAWRMLAPSSFAPAAGDTDLAFDVAAAGEPTVFRRVKTLAVRDWTAGSSWLYSTSDGWMTTGHIESFGGSTPQDFAPSLGNAALSPRRYTAVVNFRDWDDAYWRAWLEGDTFVQAKYADRVAGTVQVIQAVEGLADGPCPPGSGFGVDHPASVLGPSCVQGTGTHFTQDLQKGDTVLIAGELKTVQAIYSDTALTTTVPFKAEMVGKEMMHVLPLEPTCFDTGQCVTSPTIHFQTELNGILTESSATITGNHAPTVRPTISTVLTPALLAEDGSASTFAVGTGRPVTFFANAADPDPGDHVRVSFSACQLIDGQPSCSITGTVPLTNDEAKSIPPFTFTFLSTGRQTVELVVRDDSGLRTSQVIALTVVPSAPQWKSATSAAFVVGQAGSMTVATEPGTPTPVISLDTAIPAGLSLTDNHDGTATISGTPSHAGDYPPVRLSATTTVTYPQPNGTVTQKQMVDRLDVPMTVRRQAQTITADVPDLAVYGSAPTVYPTSSSGLPVAVTVSATSAGVCSAGGTDGHTLTLTAVGQCALVMHQAGDGTFDPATDVTASFNVDAKPVTVTIAATAQYSDPATFNTVGSTVGLVGTDALSGSVTGCTGVGLTVTGGVVTSPTGTYPETGCGGLSNPNYVVGYAGGITVSPEDATLAYNGDWLTSTGAATATTGTATLRAILTQAADGHPGDLTKAKVDFRIFKSTNTTTTPDYTVSNAAVSATGDATASITLPVDTYLVELRLSSTDRFVAARAIDELTIYQPASSTSANGGGWVMDPGASGNRHGHFGISVATKKGVPSGHLTYSWRDPANGYNYVLTSNSWQGGDANITATQATLAGKGSLTAYDPSTGLPVPGIGGGNYTFLVKAVDGSSGGSPDTYSIVIRNPQAVVIHTIAQTPIGGGHIRVHP